MKCPLHWRWLPGLIALFTSGVGVAGGNDAYSVHVWQSDDGLPHNTVTGIAQTPDGFLWITTPVRMARFDGVRFESFTFRSVGAQPRQAVTTLLADRAGGLCLGLSPGALIRLEAGKAECVTNGLPDLYAQTLTEDGLGALWLTFNRGTVCRIQNGQTTQFTENEGWPAASVASLARDNQGRIWFAKAGQVGRFQNGRFETVLRLPRSSARVAGARDGGVWIAVGTQLCRCVEGGRLRTVGEFQPHQADEEPTALLEDRSGAVWIGTKASGLFRYGGGSFGSIPTSHRQILSLAEDREGNLWVGTAGGGLNRVQVRAIILEDTATGLPFETLRSVCEDTRGVVWAATANGLLVCRAGGGWKTVSTNADWPGGAATCVAAGPDGAVWIGTRNRAVHCWREGVFTSLRQTNGLMGRATQTLLVSRSGDLWIGQTVADGLQCLRQGKLFSVALPPNIRVIQTMIEDPLGNLWIGTSKGKLLRVNGDTVSDETGQTLNVPWPIRSLWAGTDGCLWIGYGGGGLGRLQKGRFSLLGLEQGLLDESISQIVADGCGWLWIGADHGLFKVRQAELDAVAQGRAERVRSIRYGRDEGLRSLQANFGNSPGALCSRDGRLWLPMLTGVVVVTPAKLPEDPNPPPVLLERIVVDDRTLAAYSGVMPAGPAPLDLEGLRGKRDPGGGPGLKRSTEPPAEMTSSPGKVGGVTRGGPIRLPPAHHRLAFEFTAPTFAAPQNVHFRYRLEGIDEDWMEADTERRATYSRLAAGGYRFRVQSCNMSGVWGEPGAVVGFTVAPFFWQTWWFRLAALAAFTSGVVGLARYVSFRRLRARLGAAEQQAALERERARIARDIHDDLGNRLTKITLLSGLALRERGVADKAAAQVEQISSTVRQATDALDEIVWAINPRNDTLPHLINYLGQFAVEFLRTAGVRCRADLPEHPPHEAVPAEVRHNLFLALKEALNNIVCHAGATEVGLRITAHNGCAAVTIEDNGRGFNGQPAKDGSDGLRNMRQRMSDIGGQFQIESQPGAGTRICLTAHWRAEHELPR